MGQTAPPASSYKKIEDDVQVPLGKGVPTGIQVYFFTYLKFISIELFALQRVHRLRCQTNQD